MATVRFALGDVADQYEAFPYPARDPADEARRLITGSPSIPVEMDHCLWGGRRDWSQSLRVLVAGGGTGDGLIQLAARMRAAGRACDITYVDLSVASRKIAEARAAARGLTGIRFVTGSLLDAAKFGTFDYIDCCGVLHHLPDPAAGFAALRAALAPGGGLGFMVYAPHGRAGVYPLQAAFNRLYGHLPPVERLAASKAAFAVVPEGHPLRCNPHVGDHQQGDAGFYDLLVHSQDRAFCVTELLAVLRQTDWELAQFALPGLYDPAQLGVDARHLGPAARMAVAEELRGTIKVHVGYARARGDGDGDAAPDLDLRQRIPHLHNVPGAQLAKAIAAGKVPPLTVAGTVVQVDLPSEVAPLVAAIDGKRSVDAIVSAAGVPADSWAAVEAALCPWGVLHYSRIGIS